MPRVAPTIALTEGKRTQLERLVSSPTSEQRKVFRARIVLLAAQGWENQAIAEELETSRQTVGLWRSRVAGEGLGDLADRPRAGRRRSYDAIAEARIVAKTLEKPPARTHWSAARLAKEVGASASTVLRIWRRNQLQPHRTETFKYSTDPLLEAQAVDLAGLYLHPPLGALVLAVDEKSQIQALDRTQPLLPMRLGDPERRTHDYQRHGTTTLFAALNLATAEILGSCMQRHRHQEFLRFLNLINRTYPDGPIHLILDNYGTHTHPKVERWFARQARFIRHFTPTSASWMNQVESWFAILTSQAVRRGSFTSVDVLSKAIHRFIQAWNQDAQPFTWVKGAAEILVKAKRQNDCDGGH